MPEVARGNRNGASLPERFTVGTRIGSGWQILTLKLALISHFRLGSDKIFCQWK